MSGAWLFLVAYTCSGFAGLVYEVAWTRLLTVYMGHSTAAVSTVVAAFMGGLAAGAGIGGGIAARLTRRQAAYGYAALELVVALTAIVLPTILNEVAPVLGWAYRDGASGWLFPVTRVALCFAVLIVPAMALGATFPFGVRWFVPGSSSAGRAGGALYAANTAGAAAGGLISAFLLIPWLGVRGATLVAVLAGSVAIALALRVASHTLATTDEAVPDAPPRPLGDKPRMARRHRAQRADRPAADGYGPPWLGGLVLACTGAATFLLEIAWTRVFASVIGPSTYAFAATLTGLIGGLAVGSAIGAAAAGRTRRPALPLAAALGAAALMSAWVSSIAGRDFPLWILERLARSAEPFGQLVIRESLMVAVLVAPVALCLGAAYPLALMLVASGRDDVARRLGTAYAINTLASVAGSLGAGFLAIPFLGLSNTLRLGSALCLAASVVVSLAGRLGTAARLAGAVPAVAAVVLVIAAPPWDRELLASGGYKYAARVPKDVNLSTALKAGQLLHYREGPTGIVSVKQLTGDRSLAIDGKVDASTSGDMLTQKALAHLPLLLHEDPDTVCIIGLGSGVTLASALVHPVESVDVVEISPEVVEASRYFAQENRGALDDPRSRLIVGDGRAHLAWSTRQYDVIISEPSNPWMAGVAALFTREFFMAVRERLAPRGIICQWAHTYDISDADLRSIVATFRSVFPEGSMWLVGDGDLLLVGSLEPIEPRLSNIETGWRRAAVAEDLGDVSVTEPFGLWSLYVGGPGELAVYGAAAVQQTDDRMALEFSGPSAINAPVSSSNVLTIERLLDGRVAPAVIARALAGAGAAQWRDRAAMMLEAGSYRAAFDSYVKAVSRDPTDAGALAGLVRAAVASQREAEAATVLSGAVEAAPRATAPRIAFSKFLAATGSFDEALKLAREAVAIEPADPAAFDQLASVFADAGDANGLDSVVEQLRLRFPQRATTRYYAAALQFLRGRLPEALAAILQSIDLDPVRAASHNLRGAIHANLGQRPEARQAFQAALRLDAQDATAYNNLALLELSSGNTAVAADLFAEALTLDPASTAARQGLQRAR